MEKRKLLRRIAGAVGPIVAGSLALGIALAKPEKANADPAADEKAERCATRLSVAFLGKSPDATLMANKDPQSAVDSMLSDATFIDRFARFINSEMNNDPGDTAADDSSYTLAKYVLTNNKPWSDMFLGQYNVTDTVTDDPNGLGYFRSRPWQVRYAGNEENGVRIVTAYRMMQNTTGLKLTAVTKVEGVDFTATGRQAAGCRGCHYENWYALDKTASVLGIRKGTGTNVTFTAPTGGPQTILDGKTASNDKDLVTALVASENFKFHAARLAFKFLYGREETTCEGAVFDKAIDAFNAKGAMKDALSAIAKDPGFCQ